ncbi:DMT family transporter [Pelagibius sp. Alg239-R121]|uniref:DMT family transporter n=1 Tax=Pelagibius sp. Alg239-R121 TaxID=2993448 RepID=UPI0024A6763E|nr:DMT family transporter [Pelagibius sp. Alg239-R121]
MTPQAIPIQQEIVRSSALKGIILYVLAMAIVPFMDGIAKHLSTEMSVLQVSWARYFAHFAILLPIVLIKHKPKALLPRRPLLQVVRGALLLISTVCFFWAISLMPLADALAIIFVSPLVVTALSPWLLGETVGLRRWSAVLVGFLGACIIIRPGPEMFGSGAPFALAAGVCYAFYLISTRRLAGSAPPSITLFYTALVGAVVLSFVVPFTWITPNLEQIFLIAALGIIAATGHLLVIKAFDMAPASLLAPYGYSEIVMATAVGFLAFGDFPDSWTWAGVAIVIASGVYVSFRERKVKATVT